MRRFILPWVAQATQSFVHADDVREAISLALASGKHLILFGPGGHAKSEMIGEVTRALAGATTFVDTRPVSASTVTMRTGLVVREWKPPRKDRTLLPLAPVSTRFAA